MTHICVSKLTIIVSDNVLSPSRHKTIIWTNAGILLIGTLGTNFGEILSEILTFSFKKMHLKMSSAKWRQCCYINARPWQASWRAHSEYMIVYLVEVLRRAGCILGNIRICLYFVIIYKHWDGASSWKHYLRKTKNHFSFKGIIFAADNLATQ